jgi:phthalate 4,5-dioxygenase oxygenase subunit
MRAALPLSRLEDGRRRQRRRNGSEPAQSGFRREGENKAYPAREAGGFVWTFMGLRTRCRNSSRRLSRRREDSGVDREDPCRLQLGAGPGGQIDSAHSSSLHSSDMKPAKVDAAKATETHWLRPSTDKAPRLQVERTSYGFHYAAIRRRS